MVEADEGERMGARMINPENHLKIAADTIETLRKCDVYRLLNSTRDDDIYIIAEFITENRPEFADEVAECLADILTDNRRD